MAKNASFDILLHYKHFTVEIKNKKKPETEKKCIKGTKSFEKKLIVTDMPA